MPHPAAGPSVASVRAYSLEGAGDESCGRSRWFDDLAAEEDSAVGNDRAGLLLAVLRPVRIRASRPRRAEGVRDDNALRIGHGCEGERPVIAQSVVFPTDAPELTTSDPSAVVSDLSEVIAQGSSRASSRASRTAASSASRTRARCQRQRRRLPRAQGIAEPESRGARSVPVQRADLRRGVVCPATLDQVRDRRHLQREAADPGAPQGQSLDPRQRLALRGRGRGGRRRGDRWGGDADREPESATNALPIECGAGFDVTLTPSAAQVDRDLPIPYYWILKAPR